MYVIVESRLRRMSLREIFTTEYLRGMVCLLIIIILCLESRSLLFIMVLL